MNRQSFTLLDVQLGMERMSLHTLLTPSCFTFFWGLVMAANKMKPRFKNPFNLTVSQAIAAGGGTTRQAVHQKQNQLKLITIDDNQLVKIVPGNKTANLAAEYTINYDLIVPDIVDISNIPSIFLDQLATILRRSGDGVVDDLMTFLRSEETNVDKSVQSNSKADAVAKEEILQLYDDNERECIDNMIDMICGLNDARGISGKFNKSVVTSNIYKLLTQYDSDFVASQVLWMMDKSNQNGGKVITPIPFLIDACKGEGYAQHFVDLLHFGTYRPKP